MEPHDHPFLEAAEAAEATMRAGFTVHQKFTCSHCGTRQTMAVPNRFFTFGVCEECGFMTDIVAQGCNYLVVASRTPARSGA